MTAEALAAPALQHVDPGTLTLDNNVRGRGLDPKDAEDKAFIASVREHGVLVPIVARRAEDGTPRVVYGKRRTLGAVEAGLATVPVYVVDGDLDDVDRIARQLVENDQRRSLSTAERVTGWEQLAALGLTAAQIATRTATRPEVVTAGLAVAGSQLAVKAAAKYELTIDQAAVLAEFDDHPETVKSLTVTAVQEPAYFPHAAQRARDERADREAQDAVRAKLDAAGVTVVEYRYGRPGGPVELSRLHTSPDADKPLTKAQHRKCPGHAAWIEHSWSGNARYRAVYVCTDWRGNGHHSPSTARSAAGPAAPAGQAAAEVSAQRKRVIANNKAMESAQTVRRDWLRAFLAGSKPPADAAAFVADRLVHGHWRFRDGLNGLSFRTEDYLGIPTGDEEGAHPAATAAAKATPARALMIVLGLCITASEHRLDRTAWRAPDAEAIAYFRALRGWGYALAEVEQLVADHQHPTHGSPAVRRCVVCGCTDDEACEGGCSWSDVGSANGEDVCTTCVDEYTAGFAEADDDEPESSG